MNAYDRTVYDALIIIWCATAMIMIAYVHGLSPADPAPVVEMVSVWSSDDEGPQEDLYEVRVNGLVTHRELVTILPAE